MNAIISRRNALKYSAAAALSLVFGACKRSTGAGSMSVRGGNKSSYLSKRGVVLIDTDLISLNTWPQMAKNAGLNCIGIGPSTAIPSYIRDFLNAEKGQALVAECKRLGIDIEHELHGMRDMLPRSLFKSNPSMFRMNSKGERTPGFNCCAHSGQGMQVICENVVRIASQLTSTTGRYYFWFDDINDTGVKCYCPKCNAYSVSDQCLIVENQMVRALRNHVNPQAQLAHLSYQTYLAAPTQVTPEKGVFLEFAPLGRRYDKPLSDRAAARQTPPNRSHGQTLDYLDANLAVFGSSDAKVLEYWLDVSMFSDWKQPHVQIPWNNEVFLDDVNTYARRGIKDITSYAAWVDADYIRKFGMPPLKEYGEGLCQRRAGGAARKSKSVVAS